MNQEDRIKATGEAAALAAVMLEEIKSNVGGGMVCSNLSARHIDIYFPHKAKPHKAHAIRKALGIDKITKQYKPHVGCDLMWNGRNGNFTAHFMFYEVCTIVGYEDKTILATEERIIPQQIIPAKAERVDRVPIWDCKEVETEESHVN